jgi:hypothetical protein
VPKSCTSWVAKKIPTENIIAAFQNFLDCAQKDQANIAECYYTMGLLYADKDDLTMAKTFYRKGLEAENIRFACFLDYQSSKGSR